MSVDHPEPTAMWSRFLLKAAIFFYLQLLLWSALLRPSVDINVSWVPTSIFSSNRYISCIVRMHSASLSLLEASFFSALALLGYFRGCGGIDGGGRAVYGKTLASFEQAMMGMRQKFYWMCLLPWIITFFQNWLQSVGEFLVLCSGHTVYQAHNIWLTVLLMLAYFLVQALLASEVVYMALHGWCAMKNINDENVVWEKRKRFFSGITLDTVFGQVK